MSAIPTLISRGFWKTISRVLVFEDRFGLWQGDGLDDAVIGQITEAAIRHGIHLPFVREEIIAKYMTDVQLGWVVTKAVEQKGWKLVSLVLYRMVRLDLLSWVIERAVQTCSEDDFKKHILPHCSCDIFKNTVMDGLKYFSTGTMTTVFLSLKPEIEAVYRFVLDKLHNNAEQLPFIWEVLGNPWFPYILARVISEGNTQLVESMCKYLKLREWNFDLCDALAEMSKHGHLKDLNVCCVEDTANLRFEVLCDIMENVTNRNSQNFKLADKVHDWSQKLNIVNSSTRVHFLEVCDTFFEIFEKRVYIYDTEESSSDLLILPVLACVPLIVELQNEVLKLLLHEKQWNVLQHAYLRYVWEPVRRALFAEAVAQGQWSVVLQLADHTLYDDQRVEALEEAFTHKQ
jgi:hypothetical protein